MIVSLARGFFLPESVSTRQGLSVMVWAIPLSLILVVSGLSSALPAASGPERALNTNPRFDEGSPTATSAKAYALEGDARFGAFPEAQSELAGRGVRFLSSADASGRLRSGSVRQTVANISPAGGRWFRF